MDKNSWLQKTNEERQAHLKEKLANLVSIVKEDHRNARDGVKYPQTATKRIIEREITNILEFEKEEHE